MNPLARVSSDSISLSVKDYHLSHWFVVVVFNRSIFFLKIFIYLCQLQIDTCHGHLPSTSIRSKSCFAAAADLEHSLKGVQGGEQK